MITFADSVSIDDRAGDGADHHAHADQAASYADILRTLETCPLGQEDDNRGLTNSVILGEN